MKILVMGSGGREHAIAWRLAACESVETIYAAPGNPGIARVAECLSPGGSTPDHYLNLATELGVDLTVVGPEAPLVAGVVDAFRARGLRIVGPTRAAAQLEGSKVFAKQFMARAGIPTARSVTVDNVEDARKQLGAFGYPVVLKADGLAAGKGVIIAQSKAEAEQALGGLLSGTLVGTAGSRVVIEEFLAGEEVSFISLCDGKNAVALLPTQDHKAVFDGDRGPNTGGMGAYCDSRILDETMTWRIMDTVVQPTVNCMAAEGAPFTGFLYAGLMMTADGPKVLEFNVRLGDPETQPIMLRMQGDFAAVLAGEAAPAWTSDPSVCVVLAAAGYPGKPRAGDVISGIEEAEAGGATVFQAGTRMGTSGLETSGGRVLGVTAPGATLQQAIAKAYAAVGHIHFEGAHYRNDIGAKGLKRWAD
ncbi:MAG: phosphoribosylamine--glycine ligase [Acidobacteriales bacterium]|nr:phosphoribosylamine--glycine ligase [Terriglobales bacterium]